jgi:hypothetical protein
VCFFDPEPSPAADWRQESARLPITPSLSLSVELSEPAPAYFLGPERGGGNKVASIRRETDLRTRGGRCASLSESIDPTRRVTQITRIDNVVALERRTSLVASDLQRDRSGTTARTRFPYGGASKVVWDPARVAGGKCGLSATPC